MIKLTSQFDEQNMRASVATPTCGPCCSCCCCCVISTIAVSAITARSVGRAVEKKYTKESTDKKYIKKQKSKYKLLGIFMFPIIFGSIILTFLTGSIIPFILGVAFYIYAWMILRRKGGLSWGMIIRLIIMTAVFGIIEFFIILMLI